MVAAGFASNRERADELREAVEADGGTLSLHQGNVGDYEDCARVVGEVIAEHGRLDILVNNAGVTVDKPISKMLVDDWHKVLRINLSGTFYMVKPTLAHMLERGTGRIINISSITGEIGNMGQANHTASKSGPSGSTKTLPARRRHPQDDRQAQQRRVTVNVVTPGLIETDMVATIPVHGGRDAGEDPHEPDGAANEIARLVSFLAQDAAGYITGQIWGVNGGLDM